MGLFTAEVMGGREVMEAAEGANGGERWPDGGEETDELSGLRESVRRGRFMDYTKIIQLQSYKRNFCFPDF